MRLMSELSADTVENVPTLWVVATPLGNLGDLSPRAQHILETADLIAAEDTRMTQRLVNKSASQRWLSLNEHNEMRNSAIVLEALAQGQSVALVSDAGTPLISDPGYRLVSMAHDQGVRVSPIPGPSAAIAALSVAGLPSDRFHFEGFLPAKAQARRTRLMQLSQLPHTWIVYVPARDLRAVMDDMAKTMGMDRLVTLARELTKHFETVRRLGIGDMVKWLAEDSDQLRGEAVLIVSGCSDPTPLVEPRALAHQLSQALPPSKAAGLLAKVSTLSRQQAWDLIAECHNKEGLRD